MIGEVEQKAMFEKFFLINFVKKDGDGSRQRCEQLISHLRENYPSFNAEARIFAEKFCDFLEGKMIRTELESSQSCAHNSKIKDE